MKFRFAFKLGGAMAAPLILVLIVGWLGVSSLSRVHGYVHQIASDQMRVVDLTTQIQTETGLYRQWELQHILSTTIGEMDDYKTRAESSAKSIRKTMDELLGVASGEIADAAAGLAKAWQAYEATHAPLIELSFTDRKSEALNYLRGESREALYEVEKSLRSLISLARDKCKECETEAAKVFGGSRRLVVVASILAFLIGVLSTFILTRAVVSPLTELARASRMVASGDLTHELKVRRTRDESEEVSRAFAGMVSSLKELIHQVSDGEEKVSHASTLVSTEAGGVLSATERIAQSARTAASSAAEQLGAMQSATRIMYELQKAIEDIADGAQEQNAAVADTLSAVKSMNSAIREMGDAAGDVASAVERSKSASDTGVAAVERALSGLDAIKQRSQDATESMREFGGSLDRITQILQTIRDIADQTNLLALNAAIEAARAGEHGRGFAVVADEVRSLADRAAKSTKEIGDLVQEVEAHAADAERCVRSTFEEASSGRQLGDEVAKALSEVLSVVAEAGDKIEGILRGIRALGEHGDAVGRASERVAAVTERNSAATEEMSAASKEVVAAVDQARALAERNSRVVEEVSSSVAQMKASVTGLTAAADSLGEIARNLRVSVGKFRIA
ncbi:MAG: methyl-accepting chemotaxis protein [Firmicutes bacterium]|nr:methyl-accepting chemotaxis protein [Bacillota bacterium]